MKCDQPTLLSADVLHSDLPRSRYDHGFGLIAVIAILAVLMILAMAITPRFIRQMDYMSRLKEGAILQSFSEALKRSIMRNRYIPDHTVADQSGWAWRVATELGLELSQVTTNPRGGPRILLIDPGQKIGVLGGTIPYTQQASGSQIFPNQPISDQNHQIIPPHIRVMILSSLSAPLPTKIAPGVTEAFGDYSFDRIWGTAEGAIPMGWNWNGQPGDLKIQRIDLDDIFVKITFYNCDTSVQAPYYSIDNLPLQMLPIPQIGPNPTINYSAHFIKSTHLNLHKTDQSIEYSEVLQRSIKFTFRVGTWRGDSLSLGANQPGPSELQRAMNLFMRAPLNPYSAIDPKDKIQTTQRQVYDAMINYMSNFVDWREAGYPSLGSGAPLLDSQVKLGDVTTYLINKQ